MKDITKERLEKLYSVENKTIREIAKIFERSPSTIRRELHRNNIKVKPCGNYKNKEYHFTNSKKQFVEDDKKLLELFNEYMSIKEISNELGVCRRAVERRIKELGLERDKNKMMRRERYDDSNDEEIVRLYKEGKSTTEIAEIYNTTAGTILKHLRHTGLKLRTLSQCQFNYRKKDKPKELDSFEALYDLYIINKTSKKDIAKLLSVDATTIDTALKKLGIPIRGNSEAKKGLFTGKEAGNYKDGRTPLYIRLREYFGKWQAKEVLKRDGYCCQMCGSKKHLHVHHIIPFKQIFEDILSENSNLNPVENADELYEIATHDDRMNSTDNLITYCKECHLFKVHGYKKSEEKE